MGFRDLLYALRVKREAEDYFAEQRARARIQLGYAAFLASVSGPVEQAVMRDMPTAIASGDTAAWGERAVPVLEAVIAAVEGAHRPDEDDLLKEYYLLAMESYAGAARCFAAGDAVGAEEHAVRGREMWEAAIDEMESFGEAAR